MLKFKNIVLKRRYGEIIKNHVRIEKGEIGGYSIEIETGDPKIYESYLYQGKTAEQDMEHDFNLLMDYIEKIFN